MRGVVASHSLAQLIPVEAVYSRVQLGPDILIYDLQRESWIPTADRKQPSTHLSGAYVKCLHRLIKTLCAFITKELGIFKQTSF